MQVLDRPRLGAHEQRIADAALRCIGRWGVAKTTLDDVAREAGCSRATVYRTFAGGKDGLMGAVAATEVERFFEGLGADLTAAESLDQALVRGVTFASRWLHEHPALQFLIAHEPETILPHISFGSMEHLLGETRAFVAPYLARWLKADEAERAGEWVTRIVISYNLTPAGGVDMTDEQSVRQLVEGFVLPGLTREIAT